MADDKQTPAPPQQQSPAPTAAAAPAQPPSGQAQPGAEGERPDWVARAGTIVMVGSLAFLAVVVLDVALKGRLLGPLLARFAREEGEGGTPQQAGD